MGTTLATWFDYIYFLQRTVFLIKTAQFKKVCLLVKKQLPRAKNLNETPKVAIIILFGCTKQKQNKLRAPLLKNRQDVSNVGISWPKRRL